MARRSLMLVAVALVCSCASPPREPFRSPAQEALEAQDRDLARRRIPEPRSRKDEPRVLGGLPGNRHGGSINSLAFRENGRLVSSSLDGTVREWNLATTESRLLTSRRGALSGDGGALAALGSDKKVHIFELDSGKDLVTTTIDLEGFEAAEHAATTFTFSHDGKVLAGRDKSGLIRLCDSSTGKLLSTLKNSDDLKGEWHRSLWTPEHSADLPIAISHDGRFVVSAIMWWNAMAPWRLIAWDARSGETVCVSPALGAARAVAVSPDGQVVTVARGTDGLAIWKPSSPATIERVGPLRRRAEAAHVAISPDGTLIASVEVQPKDPHGLWNSSTPVERSVRLWNSSTLAEQRRLDARDGSATCVSFSPDGKVLAVGLEDGRILVWDLAERSDTR